MFSALPNTFFFTATINNWQPLLAGDNHKYIIIDSLKYCIANNRIILHGYVIMPNHIHLLLTLGENETTENFQRDFLRFTSQQIIKSLIREKNQPVLQHYLSTQADRIYHIWERRAKWKRTDNLLIFNQKLEYIHSNPLQEKWKLAETPQEYEFSSAGYYATGMDKFAIVSEI